MGAVTFADSQQFVLDCPGCDGSGTTPAPHLRAGSHPCINCGGKGTKTLKLRIPKPGDKVRVKFGLEAMLEDMFGRDDKGNLKITPRSIGIVHDVQSPDQHLLELRTGVGVRINFSGDLKKDGSIAKDKEVDLWTFDLYELTEA